MSIKSWKGTGLIVIIYCIFLSSIICPAFGSVLDKNQQEKFQKNMASLSIPFIENAGQIEDASVKYYAKIFGGTVFITRKGQIGYSFPAHMNHNKFKKAPHGWVIRESIVGSDKINATGENKTVARINHFKGKNQLRWKNNISTYNRISLGQVYPGIELRLKTYGNNVEKLFYIKPGIDPARIKMRIDGSRAIQVNESGELEIETALGPVRFSKPFAYQEIEGEKIMVPVEYRVIASERSYGFQIGNYDKNIELVVDPLLASSLLGDDSGQYAYSIAIGPSGDVYVVGSTYSDEFPVTPGAYDETHTGGLDLVVSRFDPDLTTLHASTYIGGSGNESMGGEDWRGCKAMAVDAFGNIYITGYTTSRDFPTTPGAFQTADNLSIKVFISKLNSNLQLLLASTYLTGSSNDYGDAIALDSSGNIYVTGNTYSVDFPTTPGAFDASGNGDAFVSKLDNNLSNLLASTFLGGSSADKGTAIALDSSGNVYIAGETASEDFPTTSGAYDAVYHPGDGSYNSYYDAFLSKFNNNLSILIASTFLGGNTCEGGTLIALGSGDNVFMTGYTYYESHSLIYISQFSNDLTTLISLAFMGGTSDDLPYSIAVDRTGNVYVAGCTGSSEFPTTEGAYDTTVSASNIDGFISKISGDLTTLSASTRLGGSDDDIVRAIALDASHNIYVTGTTDSADFPTSPDAYSTSFHRDDVFIAILDPDLSADESNTSNSSGDGGGGGCFITTAAKK